MQLLLALPVSSTIVAFPCREIYSSSADSARTDFLLDLFGFCAKFRLERVHSLLTSINPNPQLRSFTSSLGSSCVDCVIVLLGAPICVSLTSRLTASFFSSSRDAARSFTLQSVPYLVAVLFSSRFRPASVRCDTGGGVRS